MHRFTTIRQSATSLVCGSALLLAVGGLSSCRKATDSAPTAHAPAIDTNPKPNTHMSKQTAKSPAQRLIVSKREVGRIGTVNFDTSGRATLSTEGSGPEVDALKKAWAEISSQPKLSRIITVEEERNGKKITAIEEEEVAPGDENYIYAVFDTLSRKYGFSTDLVE
jgi:hypothetical protein